MCDFVSSESCSLWKEAISEHVCLGKQEPVMPVGEQQGSHFVKFIMIEKKGAGRDLYIPEAIQH